MKLINYLIILTTFVCLAPCYAASASDLIDVKPVTNNILVVHFDDGYVKHHLRGQKREDEQVFTSPLIIAEAMELTSYNISSTTDADFVVAVNPIDIGRKSKGTDFSWLCQSYNNGCINTSPDYAQEHWLYIFLGKPLKKGNAYTLTLNGLAGNSNSVTFVYNEDMLQSDVVHVNNLGYSTAAGKKFAYLYHWLGSKGSLDLSLFVNRNFRIIDSTNLQTVFTAPIRFRKSKTNAETGQPGETPSNNFLGADVYECDFSSFNTTGVYRLVVDGIGCSYNFSIGADAFREPFFWTMKGLYQNRSGIELQVPYTDMPRPAPHNPNLTPGFSARLKYTSTRYFDLTNSDASPADKNAIEVNYKGILHSYGWYQDAGDWDGYYTHSHVPAYLMFLYEAGRNKFADNELKIPEGGNGIADILDEAAWLMRFYKRTKDEIKSAGWGTGGVPGARVFGDLWGGDTRTDGTTKASWEDTDRDWYVSGEDPWMTYKYAALAAQMDFILRSENRSDPQGVDWREEAISAYSWATTHTRPGDENPKFGFELRHIRLYAAAALYRLTMQKMYEDDFKNLANTLIGSTLVPDNIDLNFGMWLYLQMPSNRPVNFTIYEKIKGLLIESTDRLLINSADLRACRWGGDFYFPMLIGQPTTPNVANAVYGYIAAKKTDSLRAASYLSTLHTTADYFLGCNPLNMTWISGVGEKHPVGIFHLDWWYSGKNSVIKGVVPYGPWKVQDLGPLGPWNPNWAYADKAGNPRIFPADINQWPGHERWFDQRTSPLSCEFTIHQNTVLATFLYGFLTQDLVNKTIVDVEPYLPTGIEELSQNNKVVGYPNPATSRFILRWSDNLVMKSIALFDVNGVPVRLVNLPGAGKSLELDTSALPSGVYFIRLVDHKGLIFHRRLVKS